MCSMIDFEMLVSHSPPVFSHSPPSGFLSDYNKPLKLNSDCFSKFQQHRTTCRSTSNPSYFYNHNNKLKFNSMPASPIRPCLVIRADDSSSGSSSDEDPTSPTKLKKKVIFADDKGMSLTHVRVMSEPSNVPPLWSCRFLAEVTNGITAEPEANAEPWEITFQQPASDYVDFRKRLEIGKVSLENVIIKENDEVVVGTIKVSNLAFHKEVIVRSSSDGWKTHEDFFCNYVNNSVASSALSSAYVLYDTFSFKLTLPLRTRRMEFCVCFRCEGNDFWDNNGGKNYVLVKKVQMHMHKSFSSDDLYKRRMLKNVDSKVISEKCTDVVQAKMDSWSEFASWTHLENSNPYCITNSVNSTLPKRTQP